MERERRATILRVYLKRLVVDDNGTFVDYELYSPFAYFYHQ
jgi:hypothetical protein